MLIGRCLGTVAGARRVVRVVVGAAVVVDEEVKLLSVGGAETADVGV
jgi:hypothetical protein